MPLVNIWTSLLKCFRRIDLLLQVAESDQQTPEDLDKQFVNQRSRYEK